MKEVIKYTKIAGVIVLALGGFRILLTGEHFGMSIFNYVNFSNLVIYTFDLLRGLLYNLAPIIVYLIFKDYIVRWKLTGWLSSILANPWILWILLSATIIFAGYCWFCLLPTKMTYCRNFAIKYLFEGLFLFIGYLLIRLRRIDADLVTYTLIVLFLFIYVKVNFKFELQNKSPRIIVTHKSCKEVDTLSSMITNTADFYFFKDTAQRTIIIPTSDVQKVSVDPDSVKRKTFQDCLPCWLRR